MQIKVRHSFRRRDNMLSFTPAGCVIMLDMTTGIVVVAAALLGVHIECSWMFSTRRHRVYTESLGQRLGEMFAQALRETTADDTGIEKHVGPVH